MQIDGPKFVGGEDSFVHRSLGGHHEEFQL